jgi:hypothetical protein
MTRGSLAHRKSAVTASRPLSSAASSRARCEAGLLAEGFCGAPRPAYPLIAAPASAPGSAGSEAVVTCHAFSVDPYGRAGWRNSLTSASRCRWVSGPRPSTTRATQSGHHRKLILGTIEAGRRSGVSLPERQTDRRLVCGVPEVPATHHPDRHRVAGDGGAAGNPAKWVSQSRNGLVGAVAHPMLPDQRKPKTGSPDLIATPFCCCRRQETRPPQALLECHQAARQKTTGSEHENRRSASRSSIGHGRPVQQVGGTVGVAVLDTMFAACPGVGTGRRPSRRHSRCMWPSRS